MNCCHLAFTALIVNVISLAIYAGYNIIFSRRQIKLEKQNWELKKEIQEVERVNGKEKQEIKELQDKVKKLEKVVKDSKLKGGD
jgi:cell division protein FtsB